MQFFDASREYVNACKELGFTELEWRCGEINKITGILEDAAILTGTRFRIDVSIVHKERGKKAQIYYDFLVNILFYYDTGFGRMHFSQQHLSSDYDRAKEYAEWQTTLIHKTLQHLDENDFQLDKPL